MRQDDGGERKALVAELSSSRQILRVVQLGSPCRPRSSLLSEVVLLIGHVVQVAGL